MGISRLVFSALGLVFFGLGFVGMFIPVLPTVPFWLLAAACFARGSARLYEWLMTHPKYGEYIYQYREAKAITSRTKGVAIATLWIGIGISAYIVPLWPVRILLLAVAAAVTVYLARLDTLQPGDLDVARSSYASYVEKEFNRVAPKPEAQRSPRPAKTH